MNDIKDIKRLHLESMKKLLALLCSLSLALLAQSFPEELLVAIKPPVSGGGGGDTNGYYGVTNVPVFWLKEDGLTGSDGDAVSTWSCSATTNQFTQGTAGAKPTLKTGGWNGHKSARFDGGDILISTGTLTVGPSVTLFMVFSNSNSGILLEQSVNAGNNNGFYVYGSQGCSFYVQMTGSEYKSKDAASATWALNQWVMLRVNFRTDGVSARVNNADLSTGTCVSDGNNLTATKTETFYLGSRSGSLPITGHIAEVMCFSPALSTGDAGTVETNLLTRFGVLP